jgi:hypothetical protein
MIKFFRKIRQKLLFQSPPSGTGRAGKLSKPSSPVGRYMIYAIGEIILVVIGILIALQINNWNQDRIDRKLETKTLSEISNNLKLDLEEIDKELYAFRFQQNSFKILLTQINSHALYHDSLGVHVAVALIASHFNPNYSGYQFLQSKGIDLILNDSLRSKISKLYTSDYDYYYQYQQERINLLQEIELKFSNIFGTKTTSEFTLRELSPIDNNVLQTDPTILSTLQMLSYRVVLIKSRAEKLRKQIEEVISLIEQEIGSPN